MSYRVRLYAPSGAGINSLAIYSSSGSYLGTATPAGTGTACFDRSGLTTGISITPSLQSGVSVAQWIINVDGTVYYQYSTTCTVGYVSSASNVQIRLEVSGSPTVTYYATLSYYANGGSGAPDTQYGSSDDGTGYIRFSISYTAPSRSGYTFLGWQLGGSGTIYPAGGSITVYGATSYPGASHTLYAVWQKNATGYVWIYDGVWHRYQMWIYNNGWHKALPWIYNGSWKKGG